MGSADWILLISGEEMQWEILAFRLLSVKAGAANNPSRPTSMQFLIKSFTKLNTLDRCTL